MRRIRCAAMVNDVMHTDDLHRSLPSLFDELVFGAPASGAFVLNPGDPGLLSSIGRLSAEAASEKREGGASIAAHVRHLLYGLSLLNRWAAGENPYSDADWSAAWWQDRVTPTEWMELQVSLRQEAQRWQENLRSERKVTGVELDGVVASIAHVAYHLGAMRQIAPVIRGPRDGS